MNDFIKTFENKINEFALENNAKCSELKNYKRDGVDYIELDFCLFKAVFITGYVAYGYSFFEGNDITPDNGVIVRFKFDFSDICFSPYDVHNALGLNKFEILDFHISDGRIEFEKNLDRLFDFIKENRYQLEEFAKYPSEQEKLLNCYMHDLRVASKGIFKRGLEEKTKKRLRSHEINLFYYQALAPYFSEFTKGKSKSLENQLEKRSGKGKLLMYEERYYKYLKSHDYQMPDEFTREKLTRLTKKESKSRLAYLVVLLASIILCVLTSFVIRLIVEKTVFADFTILSGGDSEMFIIPVFALVGLISITVDSIYNRKHGKTLLLPNISNKKRLVMQIICVAVLAFCLFVRVDEAFNIVGMNENQVIISEDIETQSVYDIKNDRVKFIEIQGWYDDDEAFVEDRDFIIVIDDDYENYYYTDLNEEEIENAIKIIEKNNAFAEKYRAMDNYIVKYVDEY